LDTESVEACFCFLHVMMMTYTNPYTPTIHVMFMQSVSLFCLMAMCWYAWTFTND